MATCAVTGAAVSWIGVKCNTCGIATVSIDGGAPAVVDTFGPGATGSLTSESVFSASGLAPGVTHTLVITVTGAGTAVPGSLTGSSHVAGDAFVVTAGSATSPPAAPLGLAPPPGAAPHRPPLPLFGAHWP